MRQVMWGLVIASLIHAHAESEQPHGSLTGAGMKPGLKSLSLEHPAGSSRLLLNGEWQFAEGPDGSMPAGGWQWVRVPHRSREFEDEPPTSGWYRTSLRVPEHWDLRDSDPVLDLARVRHYARVYLDDRVVGEHYGMRTPWRIQLRDLVEPGGQYELVIYTHNCSGPYAHPELDQGSEQVEKALDTVFSTPGACTIGVEGDIWLRLEPRLRISDLYVVTSVRAQTLTVEVSVRNDASLACSATLDLAVTRDGRIELDLPAQRFTVEPGTEQVVRLSAPWADPVLWGRAPYGQPVLYFLQAALRAGDQAAPVHTRVERFGFREVWADGDRLLLNGQPLMLWGDHSLPYVYERQWLTRKLVDLADGNISIVENHRYDPPSVLYEVADELGVFVVSSNFCVATGQVDEELEGDDLELVLRNNLAICETWIRRDRNHPSIFFWDVTDSRFPRFGVPLLRRARELDPTRIAEVTYDHTLASPELVELIGTYRLFSDREHIEEAITFIRSNPEMSVKPIRVGEAGIFGRRTWGYDEAPPMQEQEDWLEFLGRMPERKIHGLQTFYLTDQDDRGFSTHSPGMLAAPVRPRITWPSQSGLDARIDPAGRGTQAAWGKAELYLNWCDPDEPVSRPTATREWSRELFRKLTGRDVGPLSDTRVPEVLVQVTRRGQPIAGAQVFVEPLEGQGLAPFGIQADGAGTSWFVLPEAGRYAFACDRERVEAVAQRQPISAPPGYDHIQRVRLELDR